MCRVHWYSTFCHARDVPLLYPTPAQTFMTCTGRPIRNSPLVTALSKTWLSLLQQLWTFATIAFGFFYDRSLSHSRTCIYNCTCNGVHMKMQKEIIIKDFILTHQNIAIYIQLVIYNGSWHNGFKYFDSST